MEGLGGEWIRCKELPWVRRRRLHSGLPLGTGKSYEWLWCFRRTLREDMLPAGSTCPEADSGWYRPGRGHV